MNLNDFRYMRRGVHLSVLKPENARLLETIDLRNGKKQNALLLLHGFSSSPAVFRHLLASFSDYDAIIAPALPGHAMSIDVFANMKISGLLEFVENICANLMLEYEHVDVMGLSLGGILACHLAQRFELHHLYLLAPALDLHLATGATIKLAKCLDWLGFYRVRNQAGNIHHSNDGELTYQQLPLPCIIELLRFIKHFEFKAPNCPTDLFLGKYDEVVASELVAARFANSDNTTIHWLEDSAHILPLDGNIETIAQCVTNNLQVDRPPKPEPQPPRLNKHNDLHHFQSM